jgi:hypothetical protein
MRSPKCVILKHEQAVSTTKSTTYPKTTVVAMRADLHRTGATKPDAKYEYEDVIVDAVMQVPDAMKYGYDMATPDSEGHRSRSSSPKATVPRRSSMKGSVNSAGTSSRRASIGQTRGGGEFQVDLPGHPQPVRRRRSITFNEGVKVFAVYPIKSFTDKPESLWLQDEEISCIQQQITSLVKDKIRCCDTYDSCDSSLESGANDDECCTRGLERMLQPERTKIKRCQAWDTVMNEQYLQRQDGEFDDESLAVMYGHATRRSQREAERRASKDAEEIESYLRSTRRMCRRMSM